MPQIRSVVHFLIPAVLALLLGACATTPPVSKLQGSVQISPAVNPDATGRPSPVVLRIYELRAPGAFQNADFFSLYDKDTATLGQEMVLRDELELQPGETRVLNRELQADTRYVGVLAAFRDIDQAQWRAITPVTKGEKTNIIIKVDKLSVSISSTPK
jgi:type VI secretion system protein VasD